MDYSKLYRIQHESREVVNETIDRILTKGAEKLYIKYVLAKQPEFLGELYSKTSSIVIDNLMLSHDKGDDKKTVKRFWPEDTEPKPAAIDTWARHRINIEKPEHLYGRDDGLSSKMEEPSKLPSMSKLRATVDSIDEYSFCSDTDAEQRKAFLNAPFASECQEISVKAKIVEYDPKEEKIKRDTFEKKAKREQEAIYTKQKLENEKELEKKKKQFIQNISKKSFTFDFEGKIMFLKPSREDNIAINEFTEPGVNSKKTLMKNVNPAETNPKVKIAEIIEREGGEKTSYTQTTKNPEDEKSKKPVGNNAGSKTPAFFRPAPNLIDIVQLASGVILTTGRNQIKKGAVNKQELKPKLEEFRIKHRQGEPAPVLENTEQRNKKEEEKKMNKEKKYRRTIDDWKDELKKGLSSNIDFDPELLINLIMTDDDEKARERKQRRREEREIKIRNFQEVKKKIEEIAAHPEKFLNRIVAYRPDEIGAAEKKIVIDQSLINDFQKMVNRFNSGIIVKSDAPPTDEDYLNPPPTEMIEDKYKFTKPVGNYHSNLVPDMQPPRIRQISSAVKLSGSAEQDPNKGVGMKRIMSGTVAKHNESNMSRLSSAGYRPTSGIKLQNSKSQYIIRVRK